MPCWSPGKALVTPWGISKESLGESLGDRGSSRIRRDRRTVDFTEFTTRDMDLFLDLTRGTPLALEAAKYARLPYDRKGFKTHTRPYGGPCDERLDNSRQQAPGSSC